MRIRDNIVRMYSMMTGQTQEQITIVSEMYILYRKIKNCPRVWCLATIDCCRRTSDYTWLSLL